MQLVVLGGFYLNSALEHLGHKVYSVGFEPLANWHITRPFSSSELLAKLQIEQIDADGFFYCDNGNLPLLVDPQNLPNASIWYSIDTYCNPWHIPYGHGFDLTLVGQKDFVPLFAAEGIACAWFPLFCGAQLIAPSSTTRDIPVSFVGTLEHKNNPKRKPFLLKFKQYYPLVMLQGNFAPIFRRSLIVLNQAAFGEVNFRCFEALACGSALLTEDCANGLRELFKVGVEILPPYPHNDAISAASIARSYLANREALSEIAKAGKMAVYERHTDDVRAKSLIEYFTTLQATCAFKKRLTEEYVRRTQLLKSAFGILVCDLAQDMAHYANFYARLCK